MDDEEEQKQSWISWFLEQPGHQWMCEVQTSFIEDSFNLYGLRNEITFDFRQCLDTILGNAPVDEERHKRTNAYVWSKRLYGLIHARFILSAAGINLMLEMYEAVTFGRCPRYLCHGAPVLPVGLHAELGMETVKLFCPRCEDIYAPSRGVAGEQRLDAPRAWCTDSGFQEKQLPGDPITDAGLDADAAAASGAGAASAGTVAAASSAARSSSSRQAAAAAGSAGAAASAGSAAAADSAPVAGVGSKRMRNSGVGFFESSSAAVELPSASAYGAGAAAAASARGSTSRNSTSDRVSWPSTSPFGASGTAFATHPSQLDGAYFGPSFPHVLLISKPALLHPKSLESYVPRVYGFRVHGLRGRAALALGDSKGAYAAASVGREGVWQVGAGTGTATGAPSSSAASAAAAGAGAASSGASGAAGSAQWKARGASRLSSVVRDDGSLEGPAAATTPAAASSAAASGSRGSASKGRAKGKRGAAAAAAPELEPQAAAAASAGAGAPAASSAGTSGAAPSAGRAPVRDVFPAASPAASGGARHVPPTFRRPDEPESLGKHAAMPQYVVLMALPNDKPRAERDPALTIPYPGGARPPEDDFADSDDEGGGGGAAGGEKKARRM